jgi:hypothetical protein
MVQNTTLPSQEASAGRIVASAPKLRRLVEGLLVTAALTLGFMMAPTLQGISLVADQSPGSLASMRAADAAASEEAVRLAERP